MNNLNYNDVKERCEMTINKMSTSLDLQVLSMMKLSVLVYINLSESFGDINRNENLELISHFINIFKKMEMELTK